MRFNQLVRIARLKISLAGLAEDMAQRVMFSILPSLADPAQVALTGGIVDYKALKAAVEGRKNLIKYGVKAVLDELQNFGYDGKKSKTYQTTSQLIDSGNLEAAMDIAIVAYQTDHAWDRGYGGKAWEQISRTLRQIIRLDKQLDIIRKQSPSPEVQQQEVQVMRDIVVEMNIFDGLAHNSDDILGNLAILETRDSGKKDLRESTQENYRQLKRLMDAKELEDPVEVFRKIQPTLTDSGDINKFKDWVGKMRTKQEFRHHDPKLLDKLWGIYIRKALIPARKKLNEQRDEISEGLQGLERNWADELFFYLVSIVDIAAGDVSITTKEFDEHKLNFYRQYPELADQSDAVSKMLEPTMVRAFTITTKLDKLNKALEQKNEHIAESERATMTAKLKEALSLLNHFSYLLDAI